MGNTVTDIKKKNTPAPDKPAVIDVVCRKVQMTFYLEQTRDGKLAGEFKPIAQGIAEVDFDQSYNLKEIASDLCRQQKSELEKGKV